MYKEKWYHSPWVIGILFSLWFLIVPIILGVILIIQRQKEIKTIEKKWKDNNFEEIIHLNPSFEQLTYDLQQTQIKLEEKRKEMDAIHLQLQDKQNELNTLTIEVNNNLKLVNKIRNHENVLSTLEEQIQHAQSSVTDIEMTLKESLIKEIETNEKLALLNEEYESLSKKAIAQEKKITKLKTEYMGITTLIDNFSEAINYSMIEKQLQEIEENSSEDSFLSTIVELDLHYKDSKFLRKDMTAHNREVKKLLKDYKGRYTTKANITIYELMVIGLQAELQNILYTLSYSNLDKAIDNSKNLISKYLTICGNGNASILPTITRFLSELEPLFSDAIQIEYKYYIQKEKEKEEQRRIKEQMRQEAEERKILEMERKKLEQEEEKFLAEITKNKELLSQETDNLKVLALEERIKELEMQFNKLEEEKEEIVKRANGKAGYVYVISNLGSFGQNTFKIGMTRRLNPLDRIDELGSASVPFRFDIHAMIFSDDAVGLEQKLHQILDNNRVNKINLRKEFFNVDVVSLQNIVQDIDSTVEFTTTMKAIEYRQSQNYDTHHHFELNSASIEAAVTK